ncbi:hypothetical protein ACO0QE_002300 [Hanseniaspora vineae]
MGYPSECIVSWDFPVTNVIQSTKSIIENSNALYDGLEALDDPTMENFLLPLLQFENENDMLVNQLTFLKEVSNDEELRRVSTESARLFQEHSIETMLRRKLFTQLDTLMKKFTESKELQSEDYDRDIYHFLEKVHEDFVRAGLKLSTENQDKMAAIHKRISDQTLAFAQNLGEQKEFILFTREELDGLSDEIIDQFEKFEEDELPNSGEHVEKFKVTFKYPDIIPLLKNAKNPNTRKRAFVGDQNKVSALNEPLLLETLELRKQLGELMGYDTYADYNLAIKMAKTKETVFEFLNDLILKLKPAGEKELSVLKSLKKQDYQDQGLEYSEDEPYYVWDHSYYNNKMLKEQYDVDYEKLSHYFPLDQVLAGMLEIYESLFGLKFYEETDPHFRKVWHEDVKQLAVWKLVERNSKQMTQEKEFLGWLYLDLHPRDGKYGHAANFPIASAYHDLDNLSPNSKHYAATALVCNFSKPQRKTGKPSLLKHDEIVTLFHECGHGIHHLCAGTSNVTRFNSPGSVEWDFVEAPSQMLEFFTWEPFFLRKLSKHYETGEQVPLEMIEKLIKTKHVNSALYYLRQLQLGTFDMEVHTETKKNFQDFNEFDVCKLWNNLRTNISLLSCGEGSHYTPTKGYNSFGHIMSSAYSAGYYGYLWAEVYAADMYYSQFAPAGTDLAEIGKIGKRYRDTVLGRSGVYGVTFSVVDFLQRPANNKAFLQELGIEN